MVPLRSLRSFILCIDQWVEEQGRGVARVLVGSVVVIIFRHTLSPFLPHAILGG